MKTILALLLGLATLASAQNSEPILFTAHLRGFEPADNGEGMFSLTGNSLTYRVRAPSGFSLAAIHGPALPGTDGPLLFSLPNTGCIAPAEDREGYCDFSTRSPFIPALLLSGQQVNELISGLWYVRSVSPGAPSFPTRGQILLVPEPSTIVLALMTGCICVGYTLRKLK